MGISEIEIGRRVIYTPFKGCDPKLLEKGVVTGKNDKFVFVRYDRDIHAKATNASDLEYIGERE